MFISLLTSIDVVDIGENLHSGRILCELINHIKPGTIAKINSRPGALMERVR